MILTLRFSAPNIDAGVFATCKTAVIVDLQTESVTGVERAAVICIYSHTHLYLNKLRRFLMELHSSGPIAAFTHNKQV